MLIKGDFGALDGMQSGLQSAVAELQNEMGKLQQQASAWLEANPDMAGDASNQVSEAVRQLNSQLEQVKQMTGAGTGRTNSEMQAALASSRARFV